MGKERLKLKSVAGAVLLLTMGHAWSLSLGGVQGGVIIGRPLDILVQSSIEASDVAAGLCVEAEVTYGDTRLPAGSVTATVHRVGADGAGALRVRTTEPVTEPIVTLVLKAGCAPTFRRSYSLLADMEPAPTPSPMAPVAVVPAPVRVAPLPSAATPARAAAPVRSIAGATAPARDVPPAAAPAAPPAAPADETPIRLAAPVSRPAGVTWMKSKVRPVAVEAARPQADAGSVSQAAAPAAPAAPSGPRLQLDPVDLAPTATPVAQTAAPGTAPSADAAADTSTAAADPLVPPAESAATAAASVAQELEALRAEQARLRLAMETMNAQLAQAEATRYQNPLVYGLGAAVLALLGGLAVLWRRRGLKPSEHDVANPWWQTSIVPDTAGDDRPVASALQPVWPQTDDVEGLEVREAGESVFREVPISPLDVDALMDLWQRVDFFESIGQHREAMDALRAFVIDRPRASEAPYLRWITIAAATGQSADAVAAQTMYENHYQRLVPDASDAGLEADAKALAALVAVWPQAGAREQLQAALAAQPGQTGIGLAVHTAQAYDDVLTLLGTLDLREPDAGADGLPVLPALGAVAAAGAATGVQPPVAEAAAAQPVAPDLDLSFPSWDERPAAAEPAAPPAQAEDTRGQPLDFDFFDWDTQPKTGAEPDSPKDSEGKDRSA